MLGTDILAVAGFAVLKRPFFLTRQETFDVSLLGVPGFLAEPPDTGQGSCLRSAGSPPSNPKAQAKGF